MVDKTNFQKLFLASSFDKTVNLFVDGFELVPTQNKVAFVQNAASVYGDSGKMSWVQNDKKAFLDGGFDLEIFDFTTFKSLQKLQEKLQEFQIIHFCGGNTLYLNYLLHKSGFFETLTKYIKSGKLIFIGTSAGSMIAGPDLFDIKDSLLEDIKPKYLENMQRKDYYGLNFIPFILIPHSNDPDFIVDNSKIIQILPKIKYPLMFLADNQALLVKGTKFEMVFSEIN